MGEKESLDEFIKILKTTIKPEKVILFGSRARGDNLKTSDYDIIIVSKYFENVPFLRRMRKIYDLWNKKEHLDVLCYTPEEFERKRKEIGTVRKAVEEGIVLLEN